MSYDLDHVTRGGEGKVAWRRGKPLKKRKAVRSFRRKLRSNLVKEVDTETAEKSAQRRLGSFKQKKVSDWGVMSLKEYVADKAAGRRHIRHRVKK